MIKEKEEILEKLRRVRDIAQIDLKEKPGYENYSVKDVAHYNKKVELINKETGEKEEFDLCVVWAEDLDTKEITEFYYLDEKQVDFTELLKKYESPKPIKELVDATKENEEKLEKEQEEELKKDSLEELEAEKEKEECAEVIEEDEENIKSIAEIEQYEDTKKLKSMNHLQEIDADTKVNHYKDMEKALGLTGVQKFVIVYSEDAAKLSETEETNSSRYSMIAVMEDGSMLNLDAKLKEVPSEGKNSVAGRIQTDADEKTRISNNQASIYKIKGSDSKETFSFEQGQYGEIKVYYGNMTIEERTKFVGTQIETRNVWPTSNKLREQVSDRKGKYYADEKKEETEKHLEHGDEEVDIENSDGEKSTVECENPYVPDTKITWEQFSKIMGDIEIKELMEDFFEKYDGNNGQELLLKMQAEHKEKEDSELVEEKMVEDEYEGRVPWDSAKH